MIITWLIYLLVLSMQSDLIAITRKPRVSVLVSVYNGDEFIEGFFEDIIRQTIFNECEVLIGRADDTPGHEQEIIERYVALYPDVIKYIRMPTDPGLYAVWNILIENSSADLLTNMNIDDRRNPVCLEEQANSLENDLSIELVYGDYYVSYTPNQIYDPTRYDGIVKIPEFAPHLMRLCLPGPQPMWRRTIHEKCGLFSENLYASADLEMWNRAVSRGLRFKRLDSITGTYYFNPQGISTNKDPIKVARKNFAEQYIINAYGFSWNPDHNELPHVLIIVPVDDTNQDLLVTVEQYYRMLSGTIPYQFLLIDSTGDKELAQKLFHFPYLRVSALENIRELINTLHYDIIIVIPQGYSPTFPSFEKKSVDLMASYFPQKDGVFRWRDEQNNSILVLGKGAELSLEFLNNRKF
jgi:hypothetical protein